jgi:hypothetical protein
MQGPRARTRIAGTAVGQDDGRLGSPESPPVDRVERGGV